MCQTHGVVSEFSSENSYSSFKAQVGHYFLMKLPWAISHLYALYTYFLGSASRGTAVNCSMSDSLSIIFLELAACGFS